MSKPMYYTVADIQRCLFWDCNSSSLAMMPNFCFRSWWECDFIRVTRARYFYEYEIKLSYSDYKADAKKSFYQYKTKTYENKWESLAKRSKEGPARFYFVMPDDLANKILPELPDWAGLIAFRRRLRMLKQAPILHRERVSFSAVRQMKQSGYYRFWDFFVRSGIQTEAIDLGRITGTIEP